MPIGLWAARLERPLTGEETEGLTNLLPPGRRERLLRVKDPARRREPLCAYLLLRLALGRSSGYCPFSPGKALLSGCTWRPF